MLPRLVMSGGAQEPVERFLMLLLHPSAGTHLHEAPLPHIVALKLGLKIDIDMDFAIHIKEISMYRNSKCQCGLLAEECVSV